MKHVKLFLIALITLGTVSLSNAQSKIAHISTQELIEAMPDYQDARSQISKLQDSYSSQIEDMYKELQEKSKKYESEAPDQNDEENQKRMQDLQESNERVRNFQQSAQKELGEKQESLMKPLLDKAKSAIEKVAEQEGYEYVLDSTEGGGVLVADGHDLMPEVKKELGI